MLRSVLILFSSIGFAILSGCGAPDEQSTIHPPITEVTVTQEPLLEPWGYPFEAFDFATEPGDDFFVYANGGWLSKTEIPPDRVGTGFSVEMNIRNQARIAAIIKDAQRADAPPGSDMQKIRDLFESFMNVDQVESAGLVPFEADLKRLRTLETHQDVARAMADAEMGLPSLFNVYVGIDSQAPTTHTVWAGQGGLGLPDRAYYLLQSERLEATRTAYKTHIETVLVLLGETDAHIRAAAVFDLETAIAQQHWSRAERRDATRTYNRRDLDVLEREAGGFPWRTYFAASGLDGVSSIVVREASSIAPLADLFSETSLATWQDYLLFHYVGANARYMPQRFADANFNFFRRSLRGQKQPSPRERRAISFVNKRLEQMIGKLYIERYFPEESKRQMTDIFENIKSAYRMRIQELDWMTPETKLTALEKLDAMTGQIGYPDIWRQYDDLDIAPDDLFGNERRVRQYGRAFNIAKLHRNVDRREWTSGPQTVNAFYSPTRNQAFIPAGYIQSPLFDPRADPALNYGAIGSIIGHEIGHGFDDQGSRYGPDGRLEDWWTEVDRAAFDTLSQRLVEQFNAYEPLPGLFVNGRQTLGENIGDLAGVTVAYHAYILSLGGVEAPVLDGFSGKQRVFLGRAQARRYKRTEAGLRRRLLSDAHSPMSLRVNGIIRNMDEWYDAFNVQPDHALYLPPDERVSVW